MQDETIVNRQSSITNPPTLYALIIRLIAAHNGRLRATQGDLAHAAFLDILRQVAPDVAQTLHDLAGRKPFTISPLEGFGHGRQGELTIKAGQEGWLRITLLDPVLFHTFITYFLQSGHQPGIQLHQMHFHVSEILTTPGSHALAGAASLQNLCDRWRATADPDACRTISLHFRTPTAFSLRDPAVPHRHMHVLPDPPLVFGELAGAWDRLTGDDTQSAVRLFAAPHVVVARHAIQTHVYQYRKSKQVGFTGRVTFEILTGKDPAMTRHLNCLADLAFYTGVGSKTTMGMGQVNRF